MTALLDHVPRNIRVGFYIGASGAAWQGIRWSDAGLMSPVVLVLGVLWWYSLERALRLPRPRPTAPAPPSTIGEYVMLYVAFWVLALLGGYVLGWLAAASEATLRAVLAAATLPGGQAL